MPTKWFFCRKILKGPCSLHLIYNFSLLYKIWRKKGNKKGRGPEKSLLFFIRGWEKEAIGWWQGSQRLGLLKISPAFLPADLLLVLTVPMLPVPTCLIPPAYFIFLRSPFHREMSERSHCCGNQDSWMLTLLRDGTILFFILNTIIVSGYL